MWHSEHACFSVFFSKAPDTFLFGFTQTPPPWHCLLLRVSVCDSFGVVAVTVGFALGSSSYILQHVKQHPAHSTGTCITCDQVGVEQSERASEMGENSESRKEAKKDFVDRIACTQ